MLHVANSAEKNEACIDIVQEYNSLFQECLLELTFEEQQIWLWNSFAEMLKIKRRRK